MHDPAETDPRAARGTPAEDERAALLGAIAEGCCSAADVAPIVVAIEAAGGTGRAVTGDRADVDHRQGGRGA